jgi:ABC-type branched-subunit amino acid transport system substrate-binding protein
MQKRQFITMLSGAMLTGVSGLVRAQGAGTPGVTDREIKIGSTGPLSGPAAGYGIVGKTMSAWFDLVNAEGGVNGRQLKLVLADDGYSPPKTLEQSRRLVERDQVAFLAAQIGSSTGLASRSYLNNAKVPQLFVSSGSATWLDDAAKFPWSMGWLPLYTDEGRILARHILQTRPNAKIAMFYQNDDAGKDVLRGVKEVLAAAGKKLIRRWTRRSSPCMPRARTCWWRGVRPKPPSSRCARPTTSAGARPSTSTRAHLRCPRC